MKAGKLLLAIAVLAMAAGVCQAQTNRTRDIQRSAMRAMRNREQARKDSIEKAKAQAVIDSLNEVEAKREKQMKADDVTIRQAARRGLKRARTKGTTEEAETADVNASGKTGETQEYQVSKSSTQVSGQTTVDEKNKEKGATDNKEGANGRASRPSTGSSSSGNQQATGSRPSSTAGNNNSGFPDRRPMLRRPAAPGRLPLRETTIPGPVIVTTSSHAAASKVVAVIQIIPT